MFPIQEIEKKLGYTFTDKSLLREAFTHSSYSGRYGGKNNERLEYLGDAVLQLVVTEWQYKKDDKATEGIANIERAVNISQGRIEIMAGSGVTAACAEQIAATGVDALHFSAKKIVPGAMQYRNPRISMGGTATVDEFALRIVDEEEVKAILNILNHIK